MKNLKCVPFERNRYFYGKLLSVEDFETEQNYFNDKRKAINRSLFGSGVVCGLNVSQEGDESIVLERGLALDFAGREILVDEPVAKKIVDLEGYDPRQMPEWGSGCYYLCLEYQEHAVEPAHNLAGDGQEEYNKYREGYRLFVTQDGPKQQVFTPVQLYEEGTEIYSGNGVRIRQVFPRYVEGGSEETLRVEIENMGQQQSFSLDYRLKLSFLTYQDEITLQVHFDEKEQEKEKKYILEFPLKAADVDQVDAQIAVEPGSFELHVGKKTYGVKERRANQVRISSKPGSRMILEAYYKGAMEDTLDPAFQQPIYLAKIYVVKTEDLCLIERMEHLPFGQCIQHMRVSAAVIYQLAEEIRKLKKEQAALMERAAGGGDKQPEAACGELVFELEEVKQGETVYSERIYHGLGQGPVTIVLGYEAGQELSEECEAVYGDASVFQSSKDGFKASLGAKLEVSEGAFVIGMRIQKISQAKRVKVRWTAWKAPDQKPDVQKKRLFIQPDIPNLYAGESITFTTVSEGFEDERIKWSVKDLNGGTIDKNGKYTAPETAGVFRIGAASTAYPEIEAATFVVVQEQEENWLR